MWSLLVPVWNPAGNHACFLVASENTSEIRKGKDERDQNPDLRIRLTVFWGSQEEARQVQDPFLCHHAATCSSCREAASSVQVASLYDLHLSLPQWLCFLLTTWKYFSLYLLVCLWNHGTCFLPLHWLRALGIFRQRSTSYHVLNKVKLSWSTQEDHIPAGQILKSKHNSNPHYSKE